MIFVSLGTHEQPFERALDMVLPLAPSNPLLCQHGHTPPREHVTGVDWQAFMSYEEVCRAVLRADALICHAGIGTIITGLRLGMVPVVIPRLKRWGEHVDDHQLQITEQLHQAGSLVACGPGESVADAVVEARNRDRPSRHGSSGLYRAVAQASAS